MATDAFDDQFEPAIVEQQDVAIDDVFRQVLVIEADAFLIAELALRIEDEGFADDEHDLVVLELADANLRPLQVAEDAYGPAELGGRSADAVGARLVVFSRAVRKIHPDNVDAGLDHALQHLGRGGGGAQRGNDFGVA